MWAWEARRMIWFFQALWSFPGPGCLRASRASCAAVCVTFVKCRDVTMTRPDILNDAFSYKEEQLLSE